MSQLKIVGLSGSLSAPSRTLSVVNLTVDRIAQALARSSLATQTQVIDIAALPGIGSLRSRANVGTPEEAAFRAVESADLLVVGSPVYKGSYSGLFKHFIDFVDYRSLVGVPVALLATGGSERHALAVEHQLRPLFAVFQAHPLATGLFLSDREVVDGQIAAGPAAERFEQLIQEAQHAVALRQHARRASEVAA